MEKHNTTNTNVAPQDSVCAKVNKLQTFFADTIELKEFTKRMRRLNYAAVTMQLTSENETHKEWIADGHYWLTDFLEIIDPNLED